MNLFDHLDREMRLHLGAIPKPLEPINQRGN